MACGGCDPALSPTLMILSGAIPSPYTPSDPTLTIKGAWIQPGFPSQPCTTPHLVQFEWFEVGVSTIYRVWSSTNSPINYTGPVAASIGPWTIFLGTSPNGTVWKPNRNGTFRIRVARPNCGSTYISSFSEFVASGFPTGVPKILMTKAGIL